MVQLTTHGSNPTMNGMDRALKPTLQRRSAFEYAAWTVCILLGVGLLESVATNPNFQWDVVAKYFTNESILRGLVLTIALTVVSMVLGTLLVLILAIMRSSSITPIAATTRAYITLFRGCIVDRGDAREVLANPKERRTQAFLERML